MRRWHRSEVLQRSRQRGTLGDGDSTICSCGRSFSLGLLRELRERRTHLPCGASLLLFPLLPTLLLSFVPLITRPLPFPAYPRAVNEVGTSPLRDEGASGWKSSGWTGAEGLRLGLLPEAAGRRLYTIRS